MKIDDAGEGPDGETAYTLPQTLTDVLSGETIRTENEELNITMPPLTARLMLG